MLQELRYVPRPRQEIIELVRQAQAGNRKAADDVVKANYAYIIDIINKHFRPGGRVSMEELILAGLEGLSIAINRFDTTRGLAFTTYAAWWIKNYISRQQASFYTPLSIISSHSVREFNDVLHERGPYDSRLKRVLSATKCTVDTHGAAFDEDDPTWKVRPSVDGRLEIDEMIDAQSARVCFALTVQHANLSKRQKTVLRRRYFDGGDVRSFTDIARRMHVSRQCIEKHDENAKDKLQRAARKLGLIAELR